MKRSLFGESEQTSEVWGQPAKRKTRVKMAAILICFVASIGIFVYGFLEDKIFEYKAENDPCTTKLAAIKNGSIKCYTRVEKTTYPVFLHFCLGLFAFILGNFVHSSLLVVEEIYHYRSRYNCNIMKLWQACFSGISWAAVTVAAAVAFSLTILVTTFKNGTYELTYLVIAIGLCPLATNLLNPPTKSQVHISTILEEKESRVGQILAWSYYFDYLCEALPTLKQCVWIEDKGEVKLSSKRLILLISHNYIVDENLANLDGEIEELGMVEKGQFPIYRLKWNGKKYTFAIKYAKQPLKSLYQMSKHENTSLALQKGELDYQVKFLYGTLSKILMAPLDAKCKDKCILVPVTVESVESLQNGGLVNIIMNKVKAYESSLTNDDSNEEMAGEPSLRSDFAKTLLPVENENEDEDGDCLDIDSLA